MLAADKQTAEYLLQVAKELLAEGQQVRGRILLESIAFLYPDSEAEKEAMSMVQTLPIVENA